MTRRAQLLVRFNLRPLSGDWRSWLCHIFTMQGHTSRDHARYLPRAISLSMLDSDDKIIRTELILFAQSYDVSSRWAFIGTLPWLAYLYDEGSHPLRSRSISQEYKPEYGERKHLTQVSFQRSEWIRLLDRSSLCTTFRWHLEGSIIERIWNSWNRSVCRCGFRFYSPCLCTNHWEKWEADSRHILSRCRATLV